MKNLLLFLFVVVLLFSPNVCSGKYRLFVGTFTNTGKSEGIYLYETDFSEEVISPLSVIKSSNPGYLALSRDRKQLYSVNQNATNSAVSAFAVKAGGDSLMLINSVPAVGASPCYISATKRHVVTANYADGSVSVFGRKNDGALTNLLQFVKHTGRSVHPTRQSSPHAHQAVFTPDEKYLAVCDLGIDKVLLYKYNPRSTGHILVPCDSVAVKPGSGPRHLTFNQDGSQAFLQQELDGTLTVLSVRKGRFAVIQETSVVTKSGLETGAADIHLSPDGRFLYASNRGKVNNISCFSVQKNGALRLLSQISTQGVGPRNFTITPDGRFLLVANQYSDNIVIFKRNIETGLLVDTGKQILVGSPVCIVCR